MLTYLTVLRLLFGGGRRCCRRTLRLFCRPFGEFLLLTPFCLRPLLFLPFQFLLALLECDAQGSPQKSASILPLLRVVGLPTRFARLAGGLAVILLRESAPAASTAGVSAAITDEDLAAAILDRVLERGRFIQLDGPSHRTRHLQFEEGLARGAESARISGIGLSEFPEPTIRLSKGSRPALKSLSRAIRAAVFGSFPFCSMISVQIRTHDTFISQPVRLVGGVERR